jgi:hypothetical protein
MVVLVLSDGESRATDSQNGGNHGYQNAHAYSWKSGKGGVLRPAPAPVTTVRPGASARPQLSLATLQSFGT